MREVWDKRRVKRFEQHQLTGGVREMVLATHDVRDRKLDVVDDRGEQVTWRTVGATQHRVAERARGHRNAPVHEVLERHIPIGLHGKAQHMRRTGLELLSNLLGRERATSAVVARWQTGLLLLLAQFVEARLATEAGIREASCMQIVERCAVSIDPVALADGTLVPLHAEPACEPDEVVGVRFARARRIGVVDA